MTEELLHIKEVRMEEARDTFDGRGIKDRVVYYKGKNTQWYLFNTQDGYYSIGHASMTKVGPGHQDSCHSRFGKWWISPENRGTSLGAIYAGALIHQFITRYMTHATYKVITMHAWDELVPKYESNDWINTGKKFKGPFQELRKIFYMSWGADLIEQRGAGGKVCEGIIYPGDYLTPTLFIPKV